MFISTSKSLRRSVIALSASISLLTIGAASFAQDGFGQSKPTNVPGRSQPGGVGARQGGQGAVDQRIRRQRNRIKHALKMGTLTDEQAAKLTGVVNDIEGQVAQFRAQNNGTMKPEDFTQIDNSLNQSFQEINSVIRSGKHPVQSGDVIGPKWRQGLDGAQNADSLKREMRRENMRELRQERQNNAQKIEQQQLRYEREMIEKLGEQRENILKQKDNLKDVRKESGAD